MRLMPLLVAALACAPAAAEPAVRNVAPGSFVEWTERDGPLTIAAGNTIAAIEAAPCGGGDVGPECYRARVRVSAPGRAPITLTGEPGIFYRVAIGRLDASTSALGVVLDSFTGGAHCCHVFAIAMPKAADYRPVAVTWQPPGEEAPPQSWFDRGNIPFPTDLSGDGMADLVVRDDRFLYEFSSYAGSMAPPVVLTIGEGATVDISTDPAVAPVFEEAMLHARERCTSDESFEPNGGCAAYVADAVRLGRFDEAWQVMLGAYDRNSTLGLSRCTTERVDGECPVGREQHFADFPHALRAFLERTGYIAPR